MVRGFEFHPELLEIRQRVIGRLDRAGIAWIADYGAVDVCHEDYGLEVCAIRERAVAERIYGELLDLLPAWPCHWMCEKDWGRDPGWRIVISRHSGEAPFMGPGLKWTDVARIHGLTRE